MVSVGRYVSCLQLIFLACRLVASRTESEFESECDAISMRCVLQRSVRCFDCMVVARVVRHRRAAIPHVERPTAPTRFGCSVTKRRSERNPDENNQASRFRSNHSLNTFTSVAANSWTNAGHLLPLSRKSCEFLIHQDHIDIIPRTRVRTPNN